MMESVDTETCHSLSEITVLTTVLKKQNNQRGIQVNMYLNLYLSLVSICFLDVFLSAFRFS